MDKTETYIKMVDYPEIQNEWTPSIGDIFSHRENGRVETNPIYEATIDWADGKTSLIPIAITWLEWRNRYIWLPRQDQLQEMVLPNFEGKDRYAIYEIVDAFNKFVFKGSRSRLGALKHGLFDPSMEQLWLAFVMKEKYNKAWNGDEWTSG